MTSADILWLALRWIHAVAAVGWVGSTLFYASVVGPWLTKLAVAKGPSAYDGENTGGQLIAAEWREFLEIAAFVLVISGALLAMNRLTQPRIGASYAVLLGVKVALSIGLAFLGFRVVNVKKALVSAGRLVSWSWIMSGLGVVVILLAIILRVLFEKTLAP